MNVSRYERVVVKIDKDDPELIVAKFDGSEKVKAHTLTITGEDCWAKGYPVVGDKIYNRSKEVLARTRELPDHILAAVALELLSTVESEP